MKVDKDLIIEQLFERYYVSMIMFAKNYVRDIDDCKDIVQEIFLILVETSDKMEPVENYKAYLYNAVRNKCLKYIRHKQVEEKFASRQLVERESDDLFFNRMLEEEVYALLMQEIANLPEQCRNVFTLLLKGKNNQEIADTMNIGLETVKSHKKTGKKILYARLKNTLLFPFWGIIAQL